MLGVLRSKLFSGLGPTNGDSYRSVCRSRIVTSYLRLTTSCHCLYSHFRLDDGKFNLPLDIDDEFWDTGNVVTDFQQPNDKPSKLAFFLSLLKLQKHAMIAMHSAVRLDRRSPGFWLTSPFLSLISAATRRAATDGLATVPPLRGLLISLCSHGGTVTFLNI